MKDNFLTYLFRGLDDCITKEKKYDLELVTCLLQFKVAYSNPAVLAIFPKLESFATISKNVTWWSTEGCPVIFKYFEEDIDDTPLLE